MKTHIRPVICILLILSIFLCIVGCTPTLKSGDINFTARYFYNGLLDENSEYRNGSNFAKFQKGAAVINSRSQLKKFLAGNMTYYLSCEVIVTPPIDIRQQIRLEENYKYFSAHCDKYNSDFFKDNYLVLVFIMAPSCSSVFEITGATVTEQKELIITYTELEEYPARDEAEAYWCFLLEISRDAGTAKKDQVIANYISPGPLQ